MWHWYWIIPLSILLLIAAAVLTVTCICFFKIFYARRKKPTAGEEIPVLPGRAFDPYRARIAEWIRETRAIPHKDVTVTSFDGLRLCGKYYEQKEGAPIEILFHGYRGSAERDLCGGVYRCFALGRNALIVDQRASGNSEGHVITFGNKESRDCQTWANFVVEQIDKDARIILTGISMGAATVMTAASLELPDNVIGVLADCGYTSTEDIVKKVMRDMHLPAGLLYPFARLSARVFGGFDPSATSPIDSMRRCRLPVIFYHGNADRFVPCHMSEENYKACAAAHKRLVITEGAGHGLCFPVNEEAYLREAKDFFEPLL